MGRRAGWPGREARGDACAHRRALATSRQRSRRQTLRRTRGERILLLAAVAASLFAATLAAPLRATAQDATEDPSILERERASGNWGGFRTKLEEQGFAPYLTYTGSMWSNVGGGIRTGTEFNGFLDFGLGVDFEKLGLWKGFGFQISWHWFQGREPSQILVGANLGQAVNLWEASNAFRFFDVMLTQSFGSDGTLQMGQMAVDSNFMVSRYGANLLNASFGDIPLQNLNLDAPVYPLAGPGIYVDSTLVEPVSGKLGLYTANAGVDTSGNHGFEWQLGDNAGYALFAELAYAAKPAGLPATYTLGGYYASVREPELDGSGFVYGQWAGWVMIDQALRVRDDGDPEVGVFARGSYAPDDDRNVVGIYADAGVNVFGPIAGREKDVLAFAGGVLRFTDSFRDIGSAPGAPSYGGEAVLEVSYQIAATPWLTVQPDLQYVIDPTFADTDATVIGLEMVATF